MQRLRRLILAATLLFAHALSAAPAAAQAAKTRVVDYARDAAGNPLSGKVTFILTQKSADVADGLVIGSPSVSATLDSAGKFDVSVYPSASMSPVSYYQVYVTSGAGNQTLLGVYNIPASSSPVTLAPHKVTNANLAAQYTFASQSAVLALSSTISQATYQALLGSPTAGKLQKYDGAKLANSIVSESGSTATVGGNLNVTGAITGNCAGCTGIAGAAGGVVNTGSTTVGADAEPAPDGTGKVSIQTRNVERIGVENDGTVNIPGGLNVGGAAAVTEANTRLPPAPIPAWHPQGSIQWPTLAADAGNIYEPSVIYEGSPQILTGLSKVRKMWFTCGWGADTNVCYAESGDGKRWTRHGSPVAGGYGRGYVFKTGATYVMLAVKFPGETQMDRLTSANGLSWSVAHTNVLPLGAAGAWDETSIANPAVILDGGVYKMLYEARGASGYFKMGLATSPDTITWTKQGKVIDLPGTVGGPWFTKVGSTYWLWAHATAPGYPAGFVPLETFRWKSTDLVNWTPAPSGPVLYRTTEDEGVGNALSGNGDVFLLEADGHTEMYYAAGYDSTQQSGWAHLKLATFNGTFAQLVTTEEGVAPTTRGVGYDEPAAFQSPALQNGWVSYAAGFEPGYALQAGSVYVKGCVKSGTMSSAAFTLPMALRPATTLLFPGMSGSGTVAQINVNPDGTVVPNVGAWAVAAGASNAQICFNFSFVPRR